MDQPPVPATDESAADQESWLTSRIVDFVVRRRIAISLVVFTVLIAEDLLSGVRPHELLNLREHHARWGIGLVTAGLAIRSWAAGTLHKWAELTTLGPYGIVRHPLYLGSFLMMIGFCTVIDDGENFAWVLGPFLALYLVAILREERRLAERFPAAWATYAESVPRFLPRRWPRRPFAAWSGAQWLANHEYRAVVASLVGLLALEAWRHA